MSTASGERPRKIGAGRFPSCRKPRDLDSVIVSAAELTHRSSRAPDHAAENQALVALAREMAASPNRILQKLAETALALCGAQSAGISLLDDTGKNFYWPAVAGQWARHVGAGTPRDFGPCGTVLDRNAPLVFSHPERLFTYLEEVKPYLEEGLLVPFYAEGQAVGTVWIVMHDKTRRFDAEDMRIMTGLADFAAAAYQAFLASNKILTANVGFARSSMRFRLRCTRQTPTDASQCSTRRRRRLRDARLNWARTVVCHLEALSA